MKSVKVKKPLRVQMYFGENTEKIYQDLIELSSVTHRSVSDIVFACFVASFNNADMRDALLRGSGVSALEVKKPKKK